MKYEKENKIFYLYHLSNENLNHDFWYYAKAKHVFRTYADHRICDKKNITIVPLGFQTGFKNYSNNINLKCRKYSFAFIGQVKSDRKLLLKNLESVPNTFIHITKQWNCPTALNTYETCNIYSNTYLIPCPKGWIHADTFRICEALECGAIPILKKYDSYSYEWLGENHPIPMLDDWDDIQKLSLNIPKLQKDCYEWYSQKKIKTFFGSIIKN
jgi:hypothetical protein